MRNNYDQEKHNPCLQEQNMTYKCLDKNDYDREKCVLQMENYKVCKKFWAYVQSERRKKGIKPYLPPVEERQQVREEYLVDFRTP